MTDMKSVKSIKTIIIGLVAIAAVVVLPVSLAGATTNQQTKYVNDVHHWAPGTKKTFSNKEIVKLGKSICSDLNSGTSFAKEAESLVAADKSTAISTRALAAILKFGVVDLCPAYRPEMEAFENAPTPTAQPASPSPPTTTAPTTPPMTQQQQSALASAKEYLSEGQGFSQQGLIDQLDSPDGGQYSVNDATVAVDSLNENWNAQAVLAAKNYLQTQPFSCSALIQQLDSPDGGEFTAAQATYGATQAGDCSGGVPSGNSGNSGNTGNS
jgi:hypothetical protein